MGKYKGALLAAALVCGVSSEVWAQSGEASSAPAAATGPQGGDRIAGGVGVILTASLVGLPASAYLLAAVPDASGTAGGISMGVTSLVALVVGISEVVTGARELRARRPSPVAFGPSGLVIRW